MSELSQESRLRGVLGLGDKAVTEILAMEPTLRSVYEDALWYGSGQITFNEKNLTKEGVDGLIGSGLMSPHRKEGDYRQPLLFNLPVGSVATIEVVERDSETTWGHGVMYIRFTLPDGNTLQLMAYPNLFSTEEVSTYEDNVRNGSDAELALNNILSTTQLALNVYDGGGVSIGTQRDNELDVSGTKVRTQSEPISGLIRNQRLREAYKHSPSVLREWADRLDSVENHSTLLKDNPLYYIARNADLSGLEDQGVRVGHTRIYGDLPWMMLPDGTFSLGVERVGAVDQLVIRVGKVNLVAPLDTSDQLDVLEDEYTLYIGPTGGAYFVSNTLSDAGPIKYSAVPLLNPSIPNWVK